VAQLMSPIATLLGIQYSLKKLYEKEVKWYEWAKRNIII
jgi:hypothetical protein